MNRIICDQADNTAQAPQATRSSIEEKAMRRLRIECAYPFAFRDVTLHFAAGVLTATGRVPTFYLKQMLQTFLRDVEGVKQLDNQVDVVSATGLSSAKPKAK